MKTKIFLLISVMLLTFCLFSCGGVVSVELNGGTAEALSTDGASISQVLRTTPKKDGFIFGGWYSDDSLTQLVTSKSEDLNQVTNLYAKWITAEVKDYDVRFYPSTITDSGRKYQQCDIVRLCDDFDYQGLIFAGYTKFKVTFTFEISEQHDGYQYVFLYKNQNCVDTASLDYFVSNKLYGKTPEDPTLLSSYRFEHSPGVVDKSWDQYSFTSYIDIADLEKELYIRYGASGKYDDNWLNQNVCLRVEPLK